MARRAAVRKAWKEEQALVKATGEGTRRWSEKEAKQLLNKGKVKGYQGHHIKSVKHHPNIEKHVGNPDNIEFVTPKEHLSRHRGNYKNKTKGALLNRSFP